VVLAEPFLNPRGRSPRALRDGPRHRTRQDHPCRSPRADGDGGSGALTLSSSRGSLIAGPSNGARHDAAHVGTLSAHRRANP